MLCIKKNKCFSTVLLLSKKQTAYFSPESFKAPLPPTHPCNPFPPLPLKPVGTRSDLSKHVTIRSDPLEHVYTTRCKIQLFQLVEYCIRGIFPNQNQNHPLPLLPPPPPPTPSPFSPFFGGGGWGGGREREGKPPPPRPPGGGGGRSPPPSGF